MGNTKSAFSVPEGNNNNSQNDDDEDYGFHKRGQSLRYLRKQTPVDLSRNPSLGVADQLKRTNSLPMKVGPPKMRKSILGRSKLAPADHRNRPSSPVEVGLRPIPVQGFDLIRHHFGQCNVEDTRLTELEANIQLLNEKLADVEACRQECLRMLTDIRDNPPAMKPTTSGASSVRGHSALGRKKSLPSAMSAGSSQNAENAMRLPLAIIETYLHRVANLLSTGKEPLLLDQLDIDRKLKENSKKTARAVAFSMDADFRDPKGKSKSTMSLGGAGSGAMSVAPNPATLKDKSPSQQNICSSSQSATPLEKCQQIKQAYSQVIRSILPKLYGRNFGHRSDADFRDYRGRLATLAERVRRIPVGEEQCLLDAQKLFLVEIEGYLQILEDMVLCRFKDCSTCNKIL